MIFLDNNATTRPSRTACKAVQSGLEHIWGNPSSLNAPASEAARAIEMARSEVAELLGTQSEHLVFTSGATEANCAVLNSFLEDGRDLVTSLSEHPSVIAKFQASAPERMRVVPLDVDGTWKLDVLERHLSSTQCAIALSWANGETGVLQDAAQIGAIAAAHGAPVLLDASQVLGRVPINLKALTVDFVTVSGHKLHAPKGTGALVRTCGPTTFPPIQFGGGQERGYRAGTENVPGILGFGAACRERAKCFAEHTALLLDLRRLFETKLLSSIPDVSVNGERTKRVPNTTNICFRGVDGMALVAQLEEAGVICSQVSACSSGRPEPSRTLLAMGLSEDEAYSSLRFAFSVDNTFEDIERALKIIESTVSRLRALMEF